MALFDRKFIDEMVEKLSKFIPPELENSKRDLEKIVGRFYKVLSQN